MSERVRMPTPTAITKAEEYTRRGNYRLAQGQVVKITDYPVKNLNRAGHFKRAQFFQSAHALVQAEIGLATEQQEAVRVASHLRTARTAIETLYENKTARSVLSELDQDMALQPRDFAREIAETKLTYMLTLAALTGNPLVLDQAITMMDGMILTAVDPATQQVVVRFDRQQQWQRTLPRTQNFARDLSLS